MHSHRTQGWRVLESASVSYGKATPFFPVMDLLKRYCHVDDGDDVRTVRAKVTGQVLTLDETLQEALPALLALLDAVPGDSPFLQLDPPQRRQRTLDGLKRVLLRESQVQPLLLVFEDLHWIDAETQALLDRLVESLPTAPLLLLVNYRSEYQHGWGSKTYYTQLRLDPLPPPSADEFLQALLGDEPSLVPLKQLLIARTEGNPFFLEESVRTLVETGVLVGEPGAYRLAHHALRGEVLDKAVTYCQQAGARARDRAALGDSALQGQASLNLGGAYYAIGDFGRAAALLRHNVEAADWESGTPRTDVQIMSQAWLARTLSALWAFAEGRHHGEEALALHQLGVVHAHATPPDAAQAEAHYQQALALAEALGMRPLVAHCHQGLGLLYGRIVRAEQARAELPAAIELYRAMDMTFWLPQAEAALAQVGGVGLSAGGA